MQHGSGTSFDAGALLAQAGWMRQLAGELVADPNAAEDLVQEAWITALQRRPHPGAGLGAWLAAVMRNLARRRRGREAGRAGVELRGAQSERVEGGQESVARLEVQQMVAEALLALEEPYRTAVLLRHQDGLGSAEIARRMGIAPAAARQRVARGLAKLRGRLDRRFGGERGAWCSLFATAFDPRAGWTGGAGFIETAAVAAGGIGLVSKPLIATAALAAALAAALWWVGPFAAREDSPLVVDSESSEPAAVRDARPRAESAGSERADVVATAPSDAARRAVSSDAEALRGRVVDRRGAPIAEAVIEALEGDAAIEGARAQSGEDGRFELALPAGNAGRPALRAQHPQYFAEQLPAALSAPPGPREPLEFVLAARPVVAVRLLDADGALVTSAGAVKASVVPHDERRAHSEELNRGDDGVWRSSGLPAGTLQRIQARARGFARTAAEFDTALAAEDRVVLDVTLAPGRALHGKLVDSLSRAPIQGAEVWAEVHSPGSSASPLTTTAHDGTFELTGVEPHRVGSVQHEVASADDSTEFFLLGARAEGYGSASFIPFHARPDDPRPWVELELDPATCALEVRVTHHADGSPAAGYWAFGSDPRARILTAVADGDGMLRFADLAPGAIGLAVFDAEGVAREQGFGHLSLELAPGETRRVDLVLDPPASLSGRVLDAAGHPVAGLHLLVKLEHHGPSLGLPLGEREVVTDAQGRFLAEPLLAATARLEPRTGPDGTQLMLEPSARFELVQAERTHREWTAAPGIAVGGSVQVDASDPGPWRVRLIDPATGATLESTPAGPGANFAFGPLFPRPTELHLERAGEVVERTPIGRDGARDVLLGSGTR